MSASRPTRYAVRAASAVVAASVALLLGACSSVRGTAEPLGDADPEVATSRDLTVLAAASLQRPFERIGRLFEDAHPGVTVRFGFGGSSGLVAQLSEGAPGDVLATADEPTMADAVKAGLVSGDPKPFASNTLQVVVPADNPAGVRSLADLARPGTQVVLCAPAVPCGAASAALEKAAGVDIRPVSEEQSVTDVLGKVRSGEADAGLVYVTDVASAGAEVVGIHVPQASAAVNTYPIATLRDAAEAGLAAEFVALVTGTEGGEILVDAGFRSP